jgi:YHS domain-containing protein
MTMRHILIISVTAVALLGLLSGCGRQEEQAERREPAGQQEAARESQTSATMKMSDDRQTTAAKSDQATDPVCGMVVDPEMAVTTTYGEETYRFCSAYCQEKFIEHPEKYLPGEHMSGEQFPGKPDQTGAMDHHRMGEDEEYPGMSEEDHHGHGH